MRILKLVAALTAVLTWACGREQPPANAGPGAESSAATADASRVELGAAAQLDSGNTAYRAKDYPGALAHYRRATEREPRLAAAWFGIYMARNAMGDRAGADSAMRMVQSIAPGTMGAHPQGSTPGGTLPPGHPSTGGTSAGGLPPGHPGTGTGGTTSPGAR